MTEDAPAVEPAVDPLQVYLRQIEAMPLTTEQVAELWRRMDAGCDRARRQLIAAHLPLVVRIARESTGRGSPLPDLIQEGNLGLMKAIERCGSHGRSRFGSFAARWIRNQIDHALDVQARTIRVSRHRLETVRKLGRARDALARELGREPTDEEIGERLDLSAIKVSWLRGLAREPLSLERLMEEGGDGEPREIADRGAVSPEEAALDSEACAVLDEALEVLPPREARVLRLHFGLNGGGEKTYDEIGRLFGVSRERVRQLQERALGRLRWRARRTRLRDLLLYQPQISSRPSRFK